VKNRFLSFGFKWVNLHRYVGEYSGADGGMARMCPRDVFLCEPKNDAFSVCMQSLDCKMAKEMRVRESANPIVTFMRQMIPHHQNAVNMAKTLLKLGTGGAGYADEVGVVGGLH
jgi:uncharacterized protein (DUF305 family)